MKDPAIPDEHILFQPVRDHHGLRLALVFGNHAADGLCPYARAGRCHHCDIGFGEGVQFDTDMNIRRLEWLQQYYEQYWSQVAHLLIYNSGSTLNPRELAPAVCERIVSFARSLPKLRLLSMDSREVFIRTEYIRTLALALGAGKKLGVILGIESADDRIRNGFLNKKMSARAIAQAALRFHRVWSDVNMQQRAAMADPVLLINLVIGAPGTTKNTMLSDAMGTAQYAMDIAREYHLPLEINVHPYYPSKHSLQYFPNHPRASAESVIAVMTELNKYQSDDVHFFVGLQDEGHDQQPGQRKKELLALIPQETLRV